MYEWCGDCIETRGLLRVSGVEIVLRLVDCYM